MVAALRRGSEDLLGGVDAHLSWRVVAAATLAWIRSGPAAATAAVCLVLAGCFNNGQDHLHLFFRLVAWGMLAWIE
jgi:hypothetical protein